MNLVVGPLTLDVTLELGGVKLIEPMEKVLPNVRGGGEGSRRRRGRRKRKEKEEQEIVEEEEQERSGGNRRDSDVIGKCNTALRHIFYDSGRSVRSPTLVTLLCLRLDSPSSEDVSA